MTKAELTELVNQLKNSAATLKDQIEAERSQVTTEEYQQLAAAEAKAAAAEDVLDSLPPEE